jgi:hypothetical protein
MKVGVENGAMKVTLTKSKQWLDNLKFLVKCIEAFIVLPSGCVFLNNASPSISAVDVSDKKI